MKKKSLLLLLIIFFISVNSVFAEIMRVTGYGSTRELARADAIDKSIQKIKMDVYNNKVPSDISFEGIENIIEFQSVVVGASSNDEFKYRIVGKFDSDKAREFLSKDVNAETQGEQATISMGSKNISYSDFSESNEDPELLIDTIEKLNEERKKDQNAQNRVLRVSWGIGLSYFTLINSNSDNIVINNKLAPTANIGMVIKDRLIISLGVSPTFATRYQKDPKVQFGMKYYKTYMDLNVNYKLDWNNTFLFLGVGAGLDVDSAKEIYIMPQVAFCINFEPFRPAFESVQARIAARYTFSTRLWELGVDFTFQGLY